MKREILFKALRVDGKGWVEGFYQYDAYNFKHQIRVTGSDNIFITVEVLPETVCQFTGLTDKNGNKIFEWDKLNYPISSMQAEITIIPYLVVFNVDGFQVLNLNKKQRKTFLPEHFYLAPKRMNYKDWGKCEIIGNINDKL